MNTLKYLQNKEFLLDVGSGLLFANLEELSQVRKKRRNFRYCIVRAVKG